MRKTVVDMFAAVLLCGGAAILSAEEAAVLQFGEFDGVPGKPDAPLVEAEFSVLSLSGQTLQVKDMKGFPQRIAPGQRVAIFADILSEGISVPGHDLLLSVSLVSDVGTGGVPVAVLFNDKPLWRAHCTRSPQIITAVVPAGFLAKGDNVLQIRNDSMSIVAFDALRLERLPAQAPVGALSKMLSESGKALERLNSTAQTLSPLSLDFQRKLLYVIPREIAEYFQSGGKGFDFVGFARDRKFFDPATGRLTAFVGTALERVAPVFEGAPEVIGCNLVPSGDNEHIIKGAWCAVMNSDGAVTFLSSTGSRSATGTDVVLTLPTGWRNPDGSPVEARLEMTGGFDPNATPGSPVRPVVRKTEDVSLSDGVLEYKFRMTQCTVIRLIRKGAAAPEKIVLPDKIEIPKSAGAKVLVTGKRIQPDAIRTTIRGAGVVMPQGYAYSGKAIDATRGDIDGARNVIPWDAKSTLVEILFVDGKPLSGGALMHFGPGPETTDRVSFWVRPTASGNHKNANLKFYFNYAIPKKDVEMYSCVLKTGEWQRVEIPFDGGESPRWGNICVMGDPASPEYRAGRKVSFEFNGFCLLDKPNHFFSARVIEDKNKPGGLSGMTILLLGRPGKSGEFRYAFKSPVAFKETKLLGSLPEGAKPDLTYMQDAQMLQIKHKFPNEYHETPDELMILLTPEEKTMVTDRAFMCAGIKIVLE